MNFSREKGRRQGSTPEMFDCRLGGTGKELRSRSPCLSGGESGLAFQNQGRKRERVPKGGKVLRKKWGSPRESGDRSKRRIIKISIFYSPERKPIQKKKRLRGWEVSQEK